MKANARYGYIKYLWNNGGFHFKNIYLYLIISESCFTLLKSQRLINVNFNRKRTLYWNNSYSGQYAPLFLAMRAHLIKARVRVRRAYTQKATIHLKNGCSSLNIHFRWGGSIVLGSFLYTCDSGIIKSCIRM